MKYARKPWERFVLGAFLGALLGFAAGLLKAPQSGEQTRAAIQNHGEEARSAIEDPLREAEAKATSLARRLAEAASKLRGKTETALVAARARAEEVR